MSDLAIRTANDLKIMRERRPLVHNITNYVVMNETANAILCLGALPIMAHAVEEVEEMVSIASALVLNIGTLSPAWIEAMVRAGKRANDKGVPIVLDPVGAGATRLRTEASKRLLTETKISIVRGNAGEVAHLAGIASEVRGVESISASEPPARIASKFASDYGCTVAITGAIDVVSDGKRSAALSNGSIMMSRVVGTGCMSTAIVGCFAAVDPDPFDAAVAGLTTFGIAGEMAASVSLEKPGTFHVELYNALYALIPQDITSRAKIEVRSL